MDVSLADIIDYKFGKRIMAAEGMVITHGNDHSKTQWEVPGVPMPTEDELLSYVDETKAYLTGVRAEEMRASRLHRKLPLVLDAILDALLELDGKQPNLFSQNVKKRLTKASKVLNEVEE